MTMGNKTTFTVVGAGYVGMSIATLLGKKYNVKVYDTATNKIKKINSGESPITDELIDNNLKLGISSIKGTTNCVEAYKDADFVIVSVPTDYEEQNKKFDTTVVEEVLKNIIDTNKDAVIVLKSTVPVGFSDQIIKQWEYIKLLYSPEFIRETKSFYDSLHPTRIVVGVKGDDDSLIQTAHEFAGIMEELSDEHNVEKMIVSYAEAEAIKLFSNAFLALRVAFFNELDSFAYGKKLNSKNLIKGVCLEPRIGDYYNNPSFGYGGYCLPKDTRQLLTDYEDIPAKLIEATIESNKIRKEYLADRILETAYGINSYNDREQNKNRTDDCKNICIGVFRIAMKKGSDNYRSSSVISIMDILRKKGAKIIVYEPLLSTETNYEGHEIIKSIEELKKRSTVIIANRYDDCLEDVKHKVFTRDVFGRD